MIFKISIRLSVAEHTRIAKKQKNKGSVEGKHIQQDKYEEGKHEC